MKMLISSLSTRGWYSEDPGKLRALLDQFFAASQDRNLGRPQALVMPHAGIHYSGLVAMMALKQAAAYSYSKILVMGPSHYFPLANQVCFPDVDVIRTPLGLSVLDPGALALLRQSSLAVTNPALEAKEHSVQIELPFLQLVFPDTPIIPLVVGTVDQAGAASLRTLISELVDEETLIIMSSDFTHYGASFSYLPFEFNVPEQIKTLDFEVISALCRSDNQGLWTCFAEKERTVCGEPVFKVLHPLLSDLSGHCVAYTQSGDLVGSFETSVSYAGMCFV